MYAKYESKREQVLRECRKEGRGGSLLPREDEEDWRANYGTSQRRSADALGNIRAIQEGEKEREILFIII